MNGFRMQKPETKPRWRQIGRIGCLAVALAVGPRGGMASEPPISAPVAPEPSISAPVAPEPSISAPVAPEPSISAPVAPEPPISAPSTPELSISAPVVLESAEIFSPPPDADIPPPDADVAPPEESPPLVEEPQPITEDRTERREELLPLSGPVGLGEADALLEHAAFLLAAWEAAGISPRPETHEEAVRCIGRTERYLAGIAESLAHRTRYKWTPLGKSQPFTPDEQFDRFPKTPREPIRGATAVRITISEGDCYLKSLIVMDENKELHTYSINRWARGGLPKREVVFFMEPLPLVQVDLFMRNPGETRVRTLVEAGVPDRPEYAREIALLCGEALKRMERDQAGSALLLIGKARARLRDFRLDMSRTTD